MHKIPVSVLVVVHTAELDVLLLERARGPGYWQSVTGSLDREDEPLEHAALREVMEETGIDGAGRADTLERGLPVRDLCALAAPLRARRPPQSGAPVQPDAAGARGRRALARRAPELSSGCHGARRQRSASPGPTAMPSSWSESAL